MNNSTNIQIAIRVRPFIAGEKKANLKPVWQVKENSIVQILDETYIGEPYSFDHIFDETKSNKEVYDDVVKPLVLSCLEGINSSIFAYGQTSSGKTHTMLGDKDIPGIIGLAIDDVFRHMEQNSSSNFLLRCSYLEIYNERINDLLHTNATDLKIREDVSQGVHVIIKEEIIRTPQEMFSLLMKGMKTRKVGCTEMNERSSRSHSIFKLVIQSQLKDCEGSYTESTLSLVDLAGSERVGQMKMGKDRQQEGVSINKSLTTLGLVIRKLSEGDNFINYRDSKLTRLLQHSLGGNSKTLIIATITVAVAEETKSTLEFAQRAKFVKNRPVINRKVTDKDQLKQYESLCQNYKVQIEKLMLEKLDKERTINTLEDKINCIKIFSDSGRTSVTRHRPPSRRHTFAHIKPDNNYLAIPLLSIEEEQCGKDNETCSSAVSLISLDENERDIFEDKENTHTPYEMLSPDVTSPKTPISKVRLEKELLEQSYKHLVLFTNRENQLKAECDEFNEMRELVDRLRTENLKFREERVMVKETNNDIYNQLIELRAILKRVAEKNPKQSLSTILEEKPDLFIENFELSFSGIEAISDNKSMEEITHLKEQLSSRDQVIDALREDINNEKLKSQSAVAEINTLKAELIVKDSNIETLKASIIEDRTIKEAELNILNSKIDKFTSYKEQMHIKLSELQRLEQNDSTESLQQENLKLKNNLEALRRDNNQILEENTKFYEKLASLELQLNSTMLDLDDKSKLYNTILKNYTEKNLLVESLETKIQELQSQLEANQLKRSSFNEENLVEKLSTKLEEAQTLIMSQTCEIDHLKTLNDKQSIEYNVKVDQYKLVMADHKILSELLSEQRKCSEEKESKVSSLQSVNDDLNIKISELIDENSSMKIELQDLAFQLTGEQKELENLCQQLEEKCGTICQLDLALSGLKVAREEQTKHLAELSNTNLSLKQDISKKDEKLQDLIETNEKLTEQCQSLKQHIAELSGKTKNDEQLKDLTEANEKLTEQWNSLQQDFSEQTKRMADLSSLNLILKQDITTKDQELEDLAKTNEKLSEQCHGLNQQFSQQSTHIEELSSCNLILQRNITQKDDELQSLARTNENLMEKLHSSKQRVDEIANDLLHLRKTYEDLKGEFEKANKQLEITLRNNSEKDEVANALERKVEDLNCELEQAKIRASEIDQMLEEKELKLTKALSAYEALHVTSENQQLEIDKLIKGQSIHPLEHNCDSEQKKVEQLLQTNANLHAEKNSLKANVDNSSKNIQSLQEVIATQQTEIANLTAKWQMTKEECDQKVTDYNQVLSELQKTRKQKENLEQRSQDHICLTSPADSDNQTKSGEFDRLSAERDSLKAKTEELENCVAELKISLKKSTQFCMNMSSKLVKAQGELETCQKALSKLEQEKKTWTKTNIGSGGLSREQVVPNKQLSIASVFGNDFGKDLTRENLHDCASQTEETFGGNTKLDRKVHEHSQQMARAQEFLKLKNQQLDEQRIKLDKLATVLGKSGIRFESLTLEDRIQELLLTVKTDKLNISQELSVKTSRKSDERKSALRLSDELRKERRQSIHDQRRGLSPDIERSLSLENFDCENCTNLEGKVTQLTDEIAALTLEVNNLKTEIEFLDKEGDDMLKMLRSNEKVELELYEKLTRYENCKKADKETQASCDLQEQYNALKRIARFRRREGNELRARLNLPPDCCVIPEP